MHVDLVAFRPAFWRTVRIYSLVLVLEYSSCSRMFSLLSYLVCDRAQSLRKLPVFNTPGVSPLRMANRNAVDYPRSLQLRGSSGCVFRWLRQASLRRVSGGVEGSGLFRTCSLFLVHMSAASRAGPVCAAVRVVGGVGLS